MKMIDFRKTDINNGFWRKKTDLVSEVSVFNVYNRFKETGRFDALGCAWKKGDPYEPHIFWDSDIAKWIESVAFILEKRESAELEQYVDDAIDTIAANQEECGYFNSCYQVHDKKRWTDRTDHELYCAGHMLEAAVAYYRATGKRKLLDVMEKYLGKKESYISQIRWERDIAVSQLEDYGVQLGEQADCVRVVRCKNCRHSEEYTDIRVWCNEFQVSKGIDGFCSSGESR